MRKALLISLPILFVLVGARTFFRRAGRPELSAKITVTQPRRSSEPWRLASFTREQLVGKDPKLGAFLAASDFDFLPDKSGRAFLTLSTGRVVLLDHDQNILSHFDVPTAWSEDPKGTIDNEGLLGVALDPEFSTNGYLYILLNERPKEGVRVWRLTWSEKDPGSAWHNRKLLFLARNDTKGWGGHHNGGNLSFGPDGFLYVPIGNGFAERGPHLEQDDRSMWGKLWRLDPRQKTPPRMLAKGLRNPFSSQWLGTRLFLGDVGSQIEEINGLDVAAVEAGNKVLNFGSGLTEGPCRGLPQCTEITDPLIHYDRSRKMLEEAFGASGISRIGEYNTLATCIILGPAIAATSSQYPGLRNRLIYADAVQGWVRSAAVGPDGKLSDDRFLTPYLAFATKILQGPDEKIYFISGYDDQIHIDRLPNDGVFSYGTTSGPKYYDIGQRRPRGRAPTEYSVRFAPWNNGLAVKRFVSPPAYAKISLGGKEEPEFPVGTVFVQEFYKRRGAGEGALTKIRVTERWERQFAYFEYRVKGKALVLDERASAQCVSCHRNSVLGFTNAQLVWPATTNVALASVVWAPPSPVGLVHDAETEARGFLHANCGACHRPGGVPGDALGFRLDYTTNDLTAAKSLRSSRPLIIPGKPTQSLLWQATAWDSRAPNMPPIDTESPDPRGVESLRRWILGLRAKSP